MASKAVEKFRGPSLKSAMKHTFLMDRRDNPLDPSAGYVVRSTSEVAGLGPLSANLLRYAPHRLVTAPRRMHSSCVTRPLYMYYGPRQTWNRSA